MKRVLKYPSHCGGILRIVFSVRCIRNASKLFQRGETTVRALDAGGFVALEGPSRLRIGPLAGLAAEHGETVVVATHDAEPARRAPRHGATR